MLYLTFAVIFLLLALVGLVVGFITKSPGGFIIAVAMLLLFGGLTAFASFTRVDARAIGIQTSFGQYVDTVSSGPHWLSPWSEVEQFDTTIQPVDLNDLDGGQSSVVVAFSAPKVVGEDGKVVESANTAGGGSGNINAVVRWRISDSTDDDTGAKQLWKDFKTFERVSNELVLSESQNKIIDVAQDYPAGEAVVNTDKVGQEVEKSLSAFLSPYGIEIDSVSIKKVVPDAATQASLQTIVDNINKTAAAVEEQKRATIDNQTAKLRAQSGALDEKATVRYCLDVVNHWDVAKNGPLPATFNCGLGSNDNVLVNAK